VPLLVLAHAAPCRAQLGVSAGVGLGATNNNMNIEVPGTESDATNEADGLARTQLGLHYFLPGQSSAQAFDYALSTYIYIQGEQSVSFANELGWTALVNPTRFSQLDFSLRGAQGRTSDLDLFRGQALGGSEARPTTAESFVSASATESLRWELGPFWELGQLLNGELYAPIGDATRTTARTLGAEGRLTLSRVWTQDQLGLFVEAGHGRSSEVVFDEPMEGLLGYPARRANWGRVGLDYGHAFSDFWSVRMDAGLLAVQVPTIRDPFVDLGVGLSIAHRTSTRGTIELRGERGIDTNVYVGDVLLQNSVGLRVEQPFGYKEGWNLSADMEYQQSESLFVVDVKESLKVFSTSAILSHDWSRQTRLLFELNFTYQDAEAGLRNMLRADPFTAHRTMFITSIEWRYPELEAEVGGATRLGGRGGSSGPDGEEEEEELGGEAGASGGGDGGGDDAPER
jgi:hypothetical protein